MPRRRALTEAQLKSMLALPADEAHLIRHWTLDRTDRIAVVKDGVNHYLTLGHHGEDEAIWNKAKACALQFPGLEILRGEPSLAAVRRG